MGEDVERQPLLNNEHGMSLMQSKKEFINFSSLLNIDSLFELT